MNAQAIQRALIRERWFRSTVLPNFTPNHWFECDVFESTRAGYFVEYEVKLSKGDFAADKSKTRERYANGNTTIERKHELLSVADARGPSRFYFVTPANLITPTDVPPWAGWIIASQPVKRIHFEVQKEAPQLHRIKLEPTRLDRVFITGYWRFLRLYLK